MANTVLLKKSSTAAKVPLVTDLAYGELALNYTDGKLYFKNASNVIKSFTIDDSVVTLTGSQTLTNKTIDFANNTLTGVQPTLVSGTSIKTINSTSLLGSGDIVISGGGASALTIDNKTGAYTVVAGDLGKIINCTAGTFTVSLTAAATLGSGFNCWIWNTSNTSTDAITIDPSSTETIDGVTTLILRRGEGMQIVCDGTNWQTGDKKTMRGYADNIPVTSARPIASGSESLAIGPATQASSFYSVAIGRQTTATNIGSLAVGRGCSSSAESGSAIGSNSAGNGSQTVTGLGAMALGGSYASGTDSFAAATTDNTSTYGATGANGIALGRRAKASSNSTFAVGNTALASGLDAIAIGTTTTASGNSSVSLGYNAEALGAGSLALGSYSQAVQIGKLAYSSAYAGAWNYGFQQYGLIVLIKQTADATASVLTSNTGAASTTNQVILPNNSAYAFSGTIVARRKASEGTQTAAWRVEGLIRREGTAASTVLVNSALTVISNTPGWNIAFTADTTNGGLAVTATGAAATNIRWVATLQTSEVTYA